jgi:hypothetical protein
VPGADAHRRAARGAQAVTRAGCTDHAATARAAG